MSDTKGQHTNQHEVKKTDEKKDVHQPDKASAGNSGPGSDNTQAGSGDRGGHRRRESQQSDEK